MPVAGDPAEAAPVPAVAASAAERAPAAAAAPPAPAGRPAPAAPPAVGREARGDGEHAAPSILPPAAAERRPVPVATDIRPAPPAEAARPAADQPAPVIEVTIGRVEVRAAPAARAPRREPPPLPLADYLERRSSGR
jgi:translation initiation factor IF-2